MAEQKTQLIEKEIKTAVVNGRNLPLGLKYAIALSNFIGKKDIDLAIKQLGEVADMKRAIPMRGEIAHKSGMMSGKYPVKGAKEFIRLLKSLKSNALVKEIELEKYRLHAIPNNAPRPYKKFGQGRMKRCHVTIKLIKRENKKNIEVKK
ncbi:hypothetical protein J4218_03930 [Candidatus Pacearchaeota archaeon]|nr:hypothetical protein [Candidatus Pacearchaeota archaeon]